jgi:hypothetical protein
MAHIEAALNEAVIFTGLREEPTLGQLYTDTIIFNKTAFPNMTISGIRKRFEMSGDVSGIMGLNGEKSQFIAVSFYDLRDAAAAFQSMQTVPGKKLCKYGPPRSSRAVEISGELEMSDFMSGVNKLVAVSDDDDNDVYSVEFFDCREAQRLREKILQQETVQSMNDLPQELKGLEEHAEFQSPLPALLGNRQNFESWQETLGSLAETRKAPNKSCGSSRTTAGTRKSSKESSTHVRARQTLARTSPAAYQSRPTRCAFHGDRRSLMPVSIKI